MGLILSFLARCQWQWAGIMAGLCSAQGAGEGLRAEEGAGGTGSVGCVADVSLLCILNLALLAMLMINDGIYLPDLLVKFKGSAHAGKTYFLC